MRATFLGSAVAGALMLPALPAFAGAKVALVLGNGAYKNVTVLENPPRDAALISKKLRELDFEVIEVIDASRDAMEEALREFGRRATDADAAVFFYAGHGVQESGENYLLPVAANVKRKSDLRYETLELGLVMDELEHAAAKVSVVMLDACRDNPLTRSIAGSSTRSLDAREGLATVRGATGTLIAYATAPGEVAYDGVGQNSPFSSALAEWIDEPGLEIGLMLRRVRQNVVEATDGYQVPWVEEAILGDFYFAEGNREEAPLVAGGARPFDIADADSVFWRTITEMQTADEKRAGLNLYLDVFPGGQFVSEAQTELAALDTGQTLAGPSLTLSDVSAPGAGAFTDLLFWERIRDSLNPGDFEAYLKSYPNGLFAGVATERLTALQAGTQIAALSSDLYTRSFTIPFGSETHALAFQQAEIKRAMATVPTARVERLPAAGDVRIGPKTALIGDEISQSDLSEAFYLAEAGITGPLGEFALAVAEPGGSEVVLAADINIRYPNAPVREVAATAGVGPVPITIPLPAMSSGEQTELVIDALPYGARVLTAASEVGIDDRIPVNDGVAELAIALPESTVGDIGEIVYSYAPPARGLDIDAATKDDVLQEAITVAGIEP
ncbi:MAG: caspase family protein, partial [Geminicoccaceae bacterium]